MVECSIKYKDRDRKNQNVGRKYADIWYKDKKHQSPRIGKAENWIAHNSYRNEIHGSPLAITFAAMNIQDDIQTRWWNLEAELVERFGKKPDMEAILFLIGIQEADKFNIKFTKEQKQDLMHVAVCTLLSPSGFYVLEGHDEEGWPHFKQLKPLPEFSLKEQEDFLKDHILLYFGLQKHHSDNA